MAKRSSLSIRIVEGKNLPAKDITGSSDPYCIVKVDNESIIRTATVWKTLCPFWGEEYQVHLPPTFHTVAFYVMDEDALSRDDVIGKVCLTRDMLASHPKGFSGWTHLMEVDPNEEVQGEIHLRLEVVPGTHASRLRCSVLEARDLAPKDRNGASDPFVRVYYNGQTQETSVVKKSCYPRWNETFEFELEEGAIGALLVEAWDWDLVSRNDFLGKVVVNVQRLCSAQQEEGWFQLQPDQSKSQRGQGNLGSLQLEVRLWDETVLPSIFYQPLIQLLCQEVKLGTQGPGQLISIIEETASAECRQEVATTLLKLFLGQGLAKDFLDLLFQLELSRTSEANTIFRSNSLASKSMESFLKVAGMRYLHGILGPIIDRVFQEKKYVELDPSKVEVKDVGCSGLHRPQTEDEVLEQSAHTLRTHLMALLSAICRSVRACPAVVRATFRQLFQRVRERFPTAQHQNVPFIAVTSFLCLRFFSPAILSPKLFHLRERHADARTSRTLLLLAKFTKHPRDHFLRAPSKPKETKKAQRLSSELESSNAVLIPRPASAQHCSSLILGRNLQGQQNGSVGGPDCRQYGHGGLQGQRGMDGTTTAHCAPGRGADEGLHHQAHRHRRKGRAGPTAGTKLPGTACQGGTAVYPQDQRQRPSCVLLQETVLLPYH
ncbi:ras GTPase-activating protein 4 isoform X2 [Psammomys obesus]|uniref:ras GTPase-activating protein 4 isoform X2 n=1 Tax=Psammomys obesus TaxID=48139 RepID=UPI002453665B|nr:ras GTPase-activating protein 4 isoform X2 [Psammomys obesus]